MSNVQWNALMNMPNPGQAFAESFERGRQQRRAEHIQDQQLAWQQKQQKRQLGEWERSDNLRTATADMILQGGRPTAMAAPNALLGAQPFTQNMGTVANPAEANAPSQQPSARERAIRADPSAFLSFEGKRLELTANDLKNYREMNDTAMQLLGGVNDQATYDIAKRRAAALYASYGQDASEILAGLPAEYSPETIESLRMQGMNTSQQMAAIARENRLEWDIEDDVADNERADRNTESMIGYREERLEDYDAAEAARERRFRASEAGRDRRASRPRSGGRGGNQPSPTSVIGRIMDKQSRGEPLTAGEQKTYDEHRAGRGRSRGGGGAGRSAIIVNPKTGQRMKLEGGKWVPIK